MVQPKIYIDSKDKSYYIKYDCDCDNCNKRIVQTDVFFIISEYANNDHLHQVICLDCAKKYKKMGSVTEFRQGIIISDIPLTAIPCILRKPELKGFTGESVFSAALNISKNKGVIINDKTRIAVTHDSYVDKLIANTKPKIKPKKLRYKK